MKRTRYSLVLVCILVVVSSCLCIVLSSCLSSNNRDFRSVVESDLDGIRNREPAALEMLRDYLSTGEQFGIDSSEFASAWLSDFSYTIDSLDTKEDSAVVTVTVTSKDLQAALDSSLPEVEEIMEQVKETDSIEDAYAQAGQVVLKSLHDEETITNSLTLTYLFDGKTWVMDAQSSKTLAMVLSSGISDIDWNHSR